MNKSTYNVGFTTTDGRNDETQLDIEYSDDDLSVERVDMINLILSLREELKIKEVTYIDYVGECEEEDD